MPNTLVLPLGVEDQFGTNVGHYKLLYEPGFMDPISSGSAMISGAIYSLFTLPISAWGVWLLDFSTKPDKLLKPLEDGYEKVIGPVFEIVSFPLVATLAVAILMLYMSFEQYMPGQTIKRDAERFFIGIALAVAAVVLARNPFRVMSWAIEFVRNGVTEMFSGDRATESITADAFLGPMTRIATYGQELNTGCQAEWSAAIARGADSVGCAGSADTIDLGLIGVAIPGTITAVLSLILALLVLWRVALHLFHGSWRLVILPYALVMAIFQRRKFDTVNSVLSKGAAHMVMVLIVLFLALIGPAVITGVASDISGGEGSNVRFLLGMTLMGVGYGVLIWGINKISSSTGQVAKILRISSENHLTGRLAEQAGEQVGFLPGSGTPGQIGEGDPGVWSVPGTGMIRGKGRGDFEVGPGASRRGARGLWDRARNKVRSGLGSRTEHRDGEGMPSETLKQNFPVGKTDSSVIPGGRGALGAGTAATKTKTTTKKGDPFASARPGQPGQPTKPKGLVGRVRHGVGRVMDVAEKVPTNKREARAAVNKVVSGVRSRVVNKRDQLRTAQQQYMDVTAGISAAAAATAPGHRQPRHDHGHGAPGRGQTPTTGMSGSTVVGNVPQARPSTEQKRTVADRRNRMATSAAPDRGPTQSPQASGAVAAAPTGRHRDEKHGPDRDQQRSGGRHARRDEHGQEAQSQRPGQTPTAPASPRSDQHGGQAQTPDQGHAPAPREHPVHDGSDPVQQDVHVESTAESNARLREEYQRTGMEQVRRDHEFLRGERSGTQQPSRPQTTKRPAQKRSTTRRGPVQNQPQIRPTVFSRSVRDSSYPAARRVAAQDMRALSQAAGQGDYTPVARNDSAHDIDFRVVNGKNVVVPANRGPRV